MPRSRRKKDAAHWQHGPSCCLTNSATKSGAARVEVDNPRSSCLGLLLNSLEPWTVCRSCLHGNSSYLCGNCVVEIGMEYSAHREKAMHLAQLEACRLPPWKGGQPSCLAAVQFNLWQWKGGCPICMDVTCSLLEVMRWDIKWKQVFGWGVQPRISMHNGLTTTAKQLYLRSVSN